MFSGPSFGGFLYDIGGFGLPFMVTGSLIVLNSGVALTMQKLVRSQWNNPTIALDQSTTK